MVNHNSEFCTFVLYQEISAYHHTKALNFSQNTKKYTNHTKVHNLCPKHKIFLARGQPCIFEWFPWIVQTGWIILYFSTEFITCAWYSGDIPTLGRNKTLITLAITRLYLMALVLPICHFAVAATAGGLGYGKCAVGDMWVLWSQNRVLGICGTNPRPKL